MNTWKSHQGRTRKYNGAKYKENRAYPEAKHGYDFPSLETRFLKTHTLNFSLNKQGKGSGSLEAH